MRNLVQKAREGRLAALQCLVERNNDATSRKFSSVIVELDRISRDARLKSISSNISLHGVSKSPSFKTSRTISMAA